MNTTTGINSTLFVYQAISWLLEKKDPMSKLAKGMLFGTKSGLERHPKAVSWELTEEHLDQLDRCVNDSQTVKDEEWTEVRNEFIIAAFKDLSQFRDPKAMVIFSKLRNLCIMNDGELLLWGKKVSKRSDGSAVLVLHVSDLEAFERMLHKETGEGFLEEGLMIYR